MPHSPVPLSANIKWGRLSAGGLLAGITNNVAVLALRTDHMWQQSAAALGHPEASGDFELAAAMIIHLIIGIACVWMYVSLRPRYGRGWNTVLLSAAVVWLFSEVLPALAEMTRHVYPIDLVTTEMGLSAVPILIGSLAGALLYRGRTAEEPAEEAILSTLDFVANKESKSEHPQKSARVN